MFRLLELGYGFDALEPHVDAKTMEIHHGKHHAGYVEKLNAALEKYPDLQKQRLKNKFLFKNPKGESYSDALERLKPFWEELKQKHSNHSVLVLSHGGINRLLLGLATGVSPEEILSIDQPHDCIYVVENADSSATVSHLTPDGTKKGALKRVQLKRMPKIEEDENDVGLDDDFF